MQDILTTFTTQIEVQVAWGEMDAAQHVNNTVYLRYAESGRIHYFNQLGFSVNTTGEGDPVGPILAAIQCKYKFPLTFPDTVTIATKVKLDSFDEFSFETEQIIFSHKHQRVAAEVTAKLTCYDYKALKKAPIPEKLKTDMLAAAQSAKA